MFHDYPDRESASTAAADIIEAALQRRLEAGAEATMVASGGATPVQTFERLAARDLPWSRIHVVPSDERWVPATHDDSNERMVRTALMVGAAAAANFQPLYDDEHDIEDGAAILEQAVRNLPFPFACSLLGMGEDGHFASLFPDADTLRSALDVDGTRLVLPVKTSASPHPRMSLTLAAISRSDEIVLLIFGAAKRELLQEAAESANRFPVSQLLLQKRAPVRILWAP